MYIKSLIISHNGEIRARLWNLAGVTIGVLLFLCVPCWVVTIYPRLYEGKYMKRSKQKLGMALAVVNQLKNM